MESILIWKTFHYFLINPVLSLVISFQKIKSLCLLTLCKLLLHALKVVSCSCSVRRVFGSQKEAVGAPCSLLPSSSVWFCWEMLKSLCLSVISFPRHCSNTHSQPVLVLLVCPHPHLPGQLPQVMALGGQCVSGAHGLGVWARLRSDHRACRMGFYFSVGIESFKWQWAVRFYYYNS